MDALLCLGRGGALERRCAHTMRCDALCGQATNDFASVAMGGLPSVAVQRITTSDLLNSIF